MRATRILRRCVAAVVYFLIWGPVAVVAVYSFNSGQHALAWRGVSARWYSELFSNTAILDAVRTSLLVGTTSAATSLVLGGLLAVAIRLSKLRHQAWLQTVLLLPLFVPDIILGVGLNAFYGLLPVRTGWWSIYCAHTGFITAFVYVICYSRLHNYSFELEAAALDLGATPVRAFLTITVPVHSSTIVASFLIAFTLSLDDTVIALFTSGVGSTVLSVHLFSMTKFGVTPVVNALATTIIVVVIAFAVLALLVRTSIRGFSMEERYDA